MQKTNKNQPNILFILSDDQGPWAMGCAGNTEIETPNIDYFASSGMMFRKFFCSSPVCSPARASLLTERIPSQHGIHDWIAVGDTTVKYEPAGNGELIEYLKGQKGYTDFLSDSDYSCRISGKWHLGDSHHSQKGFEYWAIHAKGGGPYYNAPMIRDGEVYEEDNYVTNVITNNALKWLDDQRGNEDPFYLSVHYTAPHSPWSRDNHPVELYDHYYNNCPFESVPNELTPPDWGQYLSIPADNAEDRRSRLSGYYAAVTAMDQNIGKLIDWLEANDVRENTIIIFTSDNGMNMGHHGVFGKGNATYPLNMFEESVKVPFIVSRPGSIPGGAVNDDLISQYDFMPTLLDYVGIENPTSETLPGRSFAGLPQGTSSDSRDHVVVYDEYGPVRMVRTEEWKYIHRYPEGPNELYNLKNDSKEQTNLAGNSESQKIEDEMRECLTEWFSRYVDPKVDGVNEVVTGSGQLGLCGEYSGEREVFSESRVEKILTLNNGLKKADPKSSPERTLTKTDRIDSAIL